MTTYEDLYDIIGNDYGLNTGAVTTFANATETATSAAHGLTENDVIEVSNSGGALPTGLTANTKYFAITVTTDTFQLATSSGGSATPFSDDGSGTTRFHSEMKVPDLRGMFIRGWDHAAATDPDAATRTDRGDGTTGDYVGTKQADEVEAHTHGNSGAHTHDVNTSTVANGTSRVQGRAAGGAVDNVVANAAASRTHEHTSVGGNENRPVNMNMMYIIKT